MTIQYTDEKKIDMSNWMSLLNEQTINLPLTDLCIPGSHNSATSYLNPKDGVAIDEPESIRKIVGYSSCIGMRILSNWSHCQSKSITDQLECGVRYFDIRLGVLLRETRKINEEKLDDDEIQMYCCHGLYGDVIYEVISTIIDWLNSHTREIAIIDINHLYFNQPDESDKFATILDHRYSEFAYPINELIPSISEMIEKKRRILMIYQYPTSIHREYLWNKKTIISPWRNSADPQTIYKFLLSNFWNRYNGESITPNQLYVNQAICTPTTGTIVKNFYSNLRKCLVCKMNEKLLNLLNSLMANDERKRKALNIIILDFITIQLAQKIVEVNFLVR
ncbi:hypothetical protein SNEBB_004882 [Seison nebaliae]|nr:hypothetical protein SNEBB_004882 [Seison nebaliae]